MCLPSPGNARSEQFGTRRGEQLFVEKGPKKHHYVSQMQLRLFSIDGRGKQVFAYDKEADEVRVLAIADAAAQAGYYTVPTDDGPSLEVEERLALIESRVHPALER